MMLDTHATGCRSHVSLVVLLMMGSITALTGCGGGGSKSPPPVVNADPTGYYSNTGSITVMNNAATPAAITIPDAQALIANNRLILLSASQQLAYDGAISVSGNHFTGNVTIYYQGTRVSSAPVSGDIAQGTGITNGVLGGSDPWGKGSFTLNYVAADNTAASLATVNRTATDWIGPVGNSSPANFTYTIDAQNIGINLSISNGLTGGVFKGCGVVGRIDPISGTHLYSVNVNLSNLAGCSTAITASPNFTGMASTRLQGSTPLMVFSLTNGSYSLDGEFH